MMGYVTDESWFTGWVTGFGYFTGGFTGGNFRAQNTGEFTGFPYPVNDPVR
jgi:hypothetical protein